VFSYEVPNVPAFGGTGKGKGKRCGRHHGHGFGLR
jgi:hypothetical protein